VADPVTLLLIAVLVFAVSFVYANLGLGGGLLYVPIMVLLLPNETYPHQVIVPISLTFTIATALTSAYNHRRKGFVDVRLGLLLLSGALLGAVLGTVFNLRTSRPVFLAFFVAIIVLVGVKMLHDWRRNANGVDEDDDGKLTRGRKGASSVATLASGFLSGSMGIGGGLVNVPLMVYVLGRRTRTAIGTSSFMIVTTALVGFLAFNLFGTPQPIDFSLIAMVWPVVFVGAFVGSRWGLAKLRARTVALIFILVLFLAAAFMVADLLLGPNWLQTLLA
jgi:uncharacterized membrane protein YfcA